MNESRKERRRGREEAERQKKEMELEQIVTDVKIYNYGEI